LGAYLGKKGLDDLIAAVRNNYRLVTPNNSASTQTSNEPLQVLNDIAYKGGAPQRLDNLMAKAGYSGPTAMAVLYIKTSDANESDLFIGTRPDMSTKNSWRLEAGGAWMEFRGGENTARLYIQSDKDGKINVTYRPQPTQAMAPTSLDVKIGILQCVVYDDTGDGIRGDNGLRGATCIAHNRQTQEEYVGTTNSFGLAIISVPYGSYVVTVKAPRYLTQTMAVKLTEDFATLDIHLHKEQ
jgi:hypothetical protein